MEEEEKTKEISTETDLTEIENTKEENNKDDNTKDDNPKKKKSKKKIIIITSIIIVIIIAIVGFIIYKNSRSNKKIDTDWGETYYDFLKSDKSKKGKLKVEDDSLLVFIDVEGLNKPVMVENYQEDSEKYADIYYINKGKVESISKQDPDTVEFLYNQENKKYNWYVHEKTDKEEKYVPVVNDIKNNMKKKVDTEKSKEYTFQKDEKISVENTVGTKIEMPKKDTIFIKTDPDLAELEFSSTASDKELKDNLIDVLQDYKENSELIKEVKGEVNKKLSEIDKQKEAIDKAGEEVKKKQEDDAKKAEEAKKKAEEEQKKAEEESKKAADTGIKVGNYTLKYGTYIGEAASDGIKLVLSQNGQCTYDGQSCTYTVSKYDFAQDESSAGSYKDCLVIKNSSGSYYFYPYNASSIGDGGINSFNYSGS